MTLKPPVPPETASDAVSFISSEHTWTADQWFYADVHFGRLDDDPSAVDGWFDYANRKWWFRSGGVAEKGDKPDWWLRAVGPIDLGSGVLGGTFSLTGASKTVTSVSTGTVTVTTGSTAVNGSGTNFTKDFRTGMSIAIDGVGYTVGSITSDILLDVSSPYLGTTGAGKAATAAILTDYYQHRITAGMQFDVTTNDGTSVLGQVFIDRLDQQTSLTLYKAWAGANVANAKLKHVQASYTSNPQPWPEAYATGTIYGQAWGLPSETTLAVAIDLPFTGTVTVADTTDFPNATTSDAGRFYVIDDAGNSWRLNYTGGGGGGSHGTTFTGCTPSASPAGAATGHASIGATVHTRARLEGEAANYGEADKYDTPNTAEQQKAASWEPHVEGLQTDWSRPFSWRALVTGYGSLTQTEVMRLRPDYKAEFFANDTLHDFTGVFGRVGNNGAASTLVGSVGPAGQAGVALGVGTGLNGLLAFTRNSRTVLGTSTAFKNDVTAGTKGLLTPATGTLNLASASAAVVGTSTLFTTDLLTAATGTVAMVNGSTAIAGRQTKFLTEFAVGSSIWIAGVRYVIAAITDDLNATTTVAYAAATTVANVAIKRPRNFWRSTTEFPVLDIVDDTHLTLTANAGVTDATATGKVPVTFYTDGEPYPVQRINSDTQLELVSAFNESGVAGKNFFSGPDAILYRSATGIARCNSKLVTDTGLGVGNSAAATTPGSCVKKIQVFDTAGASLGFLPVYSAIT